MSDAASGCVETAETDFDVQVAYTVGVEAIVDLRTRRVRRVVIADETVRLNHKEGARQEGTLAPLPERIAATATQIAESTKWPGWEVGF